MSGQTHLLPEKVKWVIIFAKHDGSSNKTTAKKVGVGYNRPSLSHQTVESVWEKYLETQGWIVRE